MSETQNHMNNYIKTIYDVNKRPLNSYPEKLVNHLYQRFSLAPGMKLLEVGCGRCDHLKIYKTFGLDVYGLDFSQDAVDLTPEINIKECNMEKDTIPYPDEFFDVIYTKSFLEHLENPTNFLKEAKRVLKKNGTIITLVPDWESNMAIYFDDFSHKSPYTTYSLKDLYEIHGLRNSDVFLFRQLPIVWKFPVLNYLCAFLAIFTPHRSKIKFLRWSKELMVVGVAKK